MGLSLLSEIMFDFDTPDSLRKNSMIPVVLSTQEPPSKLLQLEKNFHTDSDKEMVAIEDFNRHS